jgi:hypothetical protein
MILPSSDCFRRLPHLTGNLPSVFTDATHTLGLCQELSYCCMVCQCLRSKMVWTVWFQPVILLIMALFIIVVWDRSSYRIFSYSTVWRIYRFEDIVLMDSDRYRCIFRSTTIVFEIIGISVLYSFSTISYWFHFREKTMKLNRFHPYELLPPSQKEWRFWLLDIVFDRSSYLKILCKL